MSVKLEKAKKLISNTPISRYRNYKIAGNTPLASTLKPITHGLSEVSQETGFSPSYIINLIDRYHVIQPERASLEGGATTYQFTQEDIDKLKRIRSLLNAGKLIGEAVLLISAPYQQVNKQVILALRRWQKNPDKHSVAQIFEQMGKHPSLKETERHLLVLIDGYGKNLIQAAAELNIDSEASARNTLREARAKAGQILLDSITGR